MTPNKQIRIFFILVTTILLNGFFAKSQNLIDKKIFVSKSATVTIKFSERIEAFSFEEPDTYKIYKCNPGKGHPDLLTLDAIKDIGDKTLKVTEGKRNHRFILSYKDDIVQESELTYDYSNRITLLNEVKALEAAAKAKAAAPVATPPVKTNSPIIETKRDNNFYDYLRQTDDALASDNFTDAETAYSKAQQLKPDDEKLKAERKLIDDKKNAKYTDLMAKGGSAYNYKRYDEATEYYNQATALKKDEPLPKIMLKNTQEAKEAENKRLADLQLNEQYTKAMTDASNAYNKGDYDNAIILYKEVLKIKGHENDVTVKAWITLSNGKMVDKKALEEKQKYDDQFNGYAKSAEEEFNRGAFDNAIVLYKEAIKIKGHENDKNALLRINAINKKIDDNEKELAKKKIDDQYNSAIKAGDDAFAIDQLEQAKTAYNEALKIKNGIDATATLKIKKTTDKIAENDRTERIAKQKKEAADTYNAAIAVADKAFNIGNYAAAKDAYDKADKLGVDPYPREQIKKINANIAAENAKLIALQKEADDKKRYDDALAKAEAALQKKDYFNAEINYNIAISIKQNEQYPKDKLAEIKATKEQVAKEKKAKEDQALADKKAKDDQILAEKKARDEQALADKKAKDEQLLAEREAKDAQLKAEEKQNQQYKTALSKARLAYQKKDFNAARQAYKEAFDLKPNEQEPIAKIIEIDNKLRDIALIKENNRRYDSLKSAGNSAMQRGLGSNDYNAKQLALDSAISYFQQVALLNPAEDYPKKQIDFLTSEKAKNVTKRAADDETAAAKLKNKDYLDASEDAKQLLQIANNEKTTASWEKALAAFEKVLSLKPTDSYAQNRVDIIKGKLTDTKTDDKQNTAAVLPPATKKQKRAKEQETSTAPDATKDTVPAMVAAVTQPAPSPKVETEVAKPITTAQEMVVQQTAIPYPDDELQRNYPNIDFSQIPPEQTMNGVGNSSQNYSNSNILLAEAPRLNLYETVNMVKLTIEALSFKDPNVYIKLLIENYGSNPFLVGNMLLTWNKKDGSPSKLFPGYVTAFPVIKPFNSFEVIYVTKSRNVSPDEYLFFEMSDRLKKTKFKIHIAGDIYKKEKER